MLQNLNQTNGQPIQPVLGNQPTQPVHENQPTQPVLENQPTQPVHENQSTQPVDGNQTIQPLQPIIIHIPAKSRNYDKFAHRVAIAMGAAQIVIGVLCIVLNVTSILTSGAHSMMSSLGHGIWSGIFFIVTGSIGIAAGKAINICLIIAFMVLSILSASLLVPGIIIATCFSLTFTHRHFPSPENQGGLATESLLLILGVVEFIVAVSSAVICGRGVSSGKQSETGPAAQMVYIHQQPGPSGSNIPPTVYIQQGPVQPTMASPYSEPTEHTEQQFNTMTDSDDMKQLI